MKIKKRQYASDENLPFVRKQYLLRRDQAEALKRWHDKTHDPAVDLVRSAIDEKIAAEERRLGIRLKTVK
ncbi:MAG: hypothetical protein HYR80_00305 [Nitrospirae bacterium]|nr:hypothetical protein [Nitrospirota bacterium]MBI3803511.1 hypothetical protein [Candidatus Manganitrophaceae bacterium]